MKKQDFTPFEEMFGLYTADRVPETHRDALKACREEKDTLQGSTTLYRCDSDTDYKGVTRYYIPSAYNFLLSDSGTLCLCKKEHGKSGKYYLYPYYGYRYRCNVMDAYRVSDAEAEVKEPNKIGVYSEKKVKDWMDYCDKVVAVYDRLLKEHGEKLERAKDEFASILSQFDKKHIVNLNEKDFSAYIRTPNFRVSLSVNFKQGTTQNEVTFVGDIGDVIRIDGKKN